MNENTAIQVKNISKSFKLPNEKNSSLKTSFINFYRRNKGYEQQHALKDISLDIEKGDFFGIVGRNGSGKSTLLKIISGIYTPDSGDLHVNGKLTPFIELGVGFNPELSGRENVYLNGALLGFNRNEMDKMYDEIVEFAELKRFMNQKLKNYSSGMQVRLAFSIAIRANTDILVLDEVLAVGDEAFQKKCFSYFDQLKRQKKTVILVTHDMNAVEQFCNKAALIEDGIVKVSGKPHIVAAAYSRSNEDNYEKMLTTGETKQPFKIEILNNQGKPAKSFEFMETMTVRLNWDQEGVDDAGIAIFRDNGEFVFGPNTTEDKYVLSGDKKLEYQVKLNLNQGSYFVKAGIANQNKRSTIAFIEEGPHFMVKKDHNTGKWGGVTRLEHKWK